jgi:hypothetical protein
MRRLERSRTVSSQRPASSRGSKALRMASASRSAKASAGDHAPAAVDDLAANSSAPMPEATLRRRRHRCRPVGDQVHARARAGDLHWRARRAARDRRRRITFAWRICGPTRSPRRWRWRPSRRSSHEMMRRFRRRAGAQWGTIGGNIANGSPIGDLPPALIALGANPDAAQGQRAARAPLEAFFIDYRKQDRQPGEFVESVLVPKLPAGALFAYLRRYRSASTRTFPPSAAPSIGSFRSGGPRQRGALAYGGMAGIPKRAKAARPRLLGKPLDGHHGRGRDRRTGGDFSRLTDMRASAYRLLVAGTCCGASWSRRRRPRDASRPAAEVAHELTQSQIGSTHRPPMSARA